MELWNNYRHWVFHQWKFLFLSDIYFFPGPIYRKHGCINRRRFIFPKRHHWFNKVCGNVKKLHMIFISSIVPLSFFGISINTNIRWLQEPCYISDHSLTVQLLQFSIRWRLSLFTIDIWQGSIRLWITWGTSWIKHFFES